MSRAADIRKLAEAQGQFSLRELYRHLGAQSARDKELARYGVKDLIRNGTLVRLSEGLYGWLGDGRQGWPREIADQLWRLIRMRRRITRDELRYYSGANLETIKKCVESWLAQGFIEREGLRPKGQTREAVYRLVKDQVTAPPRIWRKGKRGAKS